MPSGLLEKGQPMSFPESFWEKIPTDRCFDDTHQRNIHTGQIPLHEHLKLGNIIRIAAHASFAHAQGIPPITYAVIRMYSLRYVELLLIPTSEAVVLTHDQITIGIESGDITRISEIGSTQHAYDFAKKRTLITTELADTISNEPELEGHYRLLRTTRKPTTLTDAVQKWLNSEDLLTDEDLPYIDFDLLAYLLTRFVAD